MARAKKIAFKIAALPVAGPKLAELGLKWRFGSRVVTPYKVRNFLLAHRESASNAIEVESLPFVLNMDTLNACNLECPFCQTGTKQLVRKRSSLPVEKAKAVIDAVAEHVLAVRLYSWGEPFLNKNIFEIIRYAHDAGLYTSISSNFSVEVQDLAEKIVDSRLDHLRVSLDGLDQATNEHYRRKSKFDLVVANMRELVEMKRRKRAKAPHIQHAFLVFRHNEHQVKRLRAFRKELGINSSTPLSAFVYHESMTPKDPAFQPIQEIFQGGCHFLYSELMVEADGNISPCCTNLNPKFDIGTIEELKDLRKFWNGPRFRSMRAFVSGVEDREADPMPNLCHTCDLIGNGRCASNGLSPLPPSMVALGEKYDHGFDAGAAPSQVERGKSFAG